MSKKSNLSIQEAFDLFIRKCKIKNLTDLSICSYEKKMVHFYEFIDKSELITAVTKDTVDDYILWLRENTEANDITINSYLRSVRAFLYFCMEDRKKSKKPIQMMNWCACWRSQMWITAHSVATRHGYLKIICLVLEIVSPQPLICI